MKYIIKTVCIALGLTFMSCGDDFLDKYNPTQLTAGTYYQTKDQVQTAVNGVYSQLQDLIAIQWIYTEYITDNTTLHFNVSDRGQGPSLEAIEYFQINSGTSNITNWYNQLYRGLANINIVLYKLPESQIDDASKLDFEGQLKFMRAYYYFQLVQCFGDVILVTEPIQTPDDAYTYARSSTADVYALIESDLKTAVSSLPVASNVAANNKGRLTKGAALSLLGKVYLTKKQYGEAISTLQQVLPLGYNLMPSYADVFDPAKKNNVESVFEIQYQADTDVSEWSGFTYNFYPRESNGAVIKFTGANGGGWNVPTLEIIGAYEAGDLRKSVSLVEGYTNSKGVWVAVPFITKFYHDHKVQGRPGDNWPVIRYADVLLMLAEAINEQSGPGDAYSYMNQTRVRAGLAPLSGLSKESFRTAVLKERRIELAFENHRWYDLKRTKSAAELATFLNAYATFEKSKPTTDRGGIPFSAGDYVFEPFEALFPIPANEILINKDLTQNEGYK
jgi:starch-binding outer membrane protein, SusD/RagB family